MNCFFKLLYVILNIKKNYKIKQNNDNLMALRYIDWESGPEYPKILNETDFKKIKKLIVFLEENLIKI